MMLLKEIVQTCPDVTWSAAKLWCAVHPNDITRLEQEADTAIEQVGTPIEAKSQMARELWTRHKKGFALAVSVKNKIMLLASRQTLKKKQGGDMQSYCGQQAH